MTTTIRSSNTIVSATLAAATIAAVLVMLAPAFAQAALTRQLQEGMSGADVSELQTYLATDSTIYPQGLVTGYFGSLTKTAVSNYQARNGIAVVGRVGPVTLASINSKMAGGGGVSWDTVPTLSSVNVNTSATSATLTWTTNEPSRAVVYYGTSFLSETEGPTVSIGGTPVAPDTVLRNAHNVTLTGLQPNTTYYYVVYVTDAAGGDAMTMQTTFKTTL
jgi:peptidoglycan hydrolase-like protein with peptidoglycan-binding domain